MRLNTAFARNIVHGGLLATATLLAAPALIADVRIAVVDSQRAVLESEDGLRVKAQLNKIFDEKQRELDLKQNELQKERQELEKQRTTMKPEVLQQRAEKWQAEAANVQQMFMEYNRELQRKQSEMMQPILNQTLAAVQRIAKAEGYTIVIERQAAAYVQSDLDITERVIRAHNEGGTSGAPATAPTAAPAPKTPAKTPTALPPKK
jgi:outer membrane protein